VQLIMLAFAPGVFILLYVYFRDRYERERPITVLKVFLWGMLAVLPAIQLETWLAPAARNLHGASTAALAVSVFLVIGPVEELCKFFVVWFRIYPSDEFNEPMDGLVYSTAAAMGFASIENLLYLAHHGTEAAPVRALLAVPGHLFFSGIWGYHLGLAKFQKNPGGTIAGSLVASSFLHGVYDFLVASQTGLAALSVPLMAVLAYGFLKEIDAALEVSPMKPGATPPAPEPERVVTCPGCGGLTSTATDICQHCGLTQPPEGVDEGGH
jgi:RsiW-degrading membrane proteinase PrsW (M82 family)